MKLLLSAYACAPGHGSERDGGWNCVRQAARFHDVWVLTQKVGHPEIEATFDKEPLPKARFVYLDLPAVAGLLKKWRRGAELHYYLWQLAAYFAGRGLHRKIGFDLIHHVTLGRYWMPSFLTLLPVPFIWVPVGGGESAPCAFWRSFSFQGKVSELARDLARKIGECDPFVRNSARKATVALATTEETAKRMRALGCRQVSVFPVVGLPQDEVQLLSSIPRPQSTLFRLISIGSLIHWKGFHLGIRAFAIFHSEFPASEYWLIGDGPERKRLEKLARKLGIRKNIKFWGFLPRPQVLEKFADSDVLVHPSLHESGGWVCLEAMAAGRPVICLDLGGPALQVTAETGVKVPAITPEQAVIDLAQSLSLLAGDPALCARMGRAGRQRVNARFRWAEKGAFLTATYESESKKPQNENSPCH